MAKGLTQRELYNKNRTRPKKSPAERRRRERVQRRRLAALGVPEQIAQRLDPVTVRRLLRHPKKIQQRLRAQVSATAAG
jgi:hypothetical protein